MPTLQQCHILGNKFCLGAIVCVNPPTNSEYPTFGEIVCIFVPDDSKKLLLHLYNIQTYSLHFNAYLIVQNTQFSVLSICQLEIHEVYHRYMVSPHTYISIKSYHHVEFDIKFNMSHISVLTPVTIILSFDFYQWYGIVTYLYGNIMIVWYNVMTCIRATMLIQHTLQHVARM